MNYAFSPIHGYRMYIILFVIKIIATLIGRCGNKTVRFKKISNTITHFILVVLLTDCLCELHNVFTTLGDNIIDCKSRGIATVDSLLYRADFPGWLFYILMLVVIMVVLMVESGPNIKAKPRKKAIIMVLLVSVGIVIANLLNSFSVYEYCGLECPGISFWLVAIISGLIYGGDVSYLYYATNVVSLLAIPLYITIVNYACVPRMDMEQTCKMVKRLKTLNDVALVLFVIHFFRDTFLWLESYAYTPMVVCTFVLKLYFSGVLKEKNKNYKNP